MAASISCISACRKYLIHFAHDHLEFRLPELQSIARLLGITLGSVADYSNQSPYFVVSLPSEESAKQIASRAVLVKSVYELWSEGSSYEDLFQQLQAMPASFTRPYLCSDSTFRLRHDSFNKQVNHRDKVTLIEKVISDSGLSFNGDIKLGDPDHSFHILESYSSKQPPAHPLVIYFGRWITDGHREAINTYNLKKRRFIGNTSMDAGLAMVMANMGCASRNMLVFDPFVGTGSLLIACAHFGSYVLGTDIDWNLLHGKGRASRANQKWRCQDDNIRSCLGQYNLQHLYVDAMIADSSCHAMWHQQGEIFDAIITDPPYGIREPTKKVGTTKADAVIPDELKPGHVPSKVSYDLSQILVDLLNFSAKFLRVGGRLVYWLPIYRQEYTDDSIPKHQCLKLISNCEQPLNIKVCRRLITMEKQQNFKEEFRLRSLSHDHYKDGSFREKYFRPLDKPTSKWQRRDGATEDCSDGVIPSATAKSSDGQRTGRTEEQVSPTEHVDLSNTESQHPSIIEGQFASDEVGDRS